MNFKKISYTVIASILSLFLVQQGTMYTVKAVEAVPTKNVKRIQGLNRLQTSMSIAEEVKNGQLENIVLAYAYDFPDALSGSTLAKKLNAPLLLVGKKEESKEVLQYISAHVVEKGNIYILGGSAVVGQDIEQALSQKGYKIIRLAGKNRIETCNVIINNMAIDKDTPVFIAASTGFADALSASGVAASKGYPILLTEKDVLSPLMKDQIMKIGPGKVYIVGGTGVISSAVEEQIKALVPNAVVNRFAGNDRYETSMKVYTYFNAGAKDVVLASGKNFPDALSGSLLAAKLDASIVLADEENLDLQQSAFNEKKVENFYLLGGTGALSENVEAAILFDAEKEKENIKTMITKAMDALRSGKLDEYMSSIDESIQGYGDTKKFIQELMTFVATNKLDIIPTLDSMEVVSINYKEATINTVETATLKSSDGSTVNQKTSSFTYNLRKTKGQWTVYRSTALAEIVNP